MTNHRTGFRPFVVQLDVPPAPDGKARPPRVYEVSYQDSKKHVRVYRRDGTTLRRVTDAREGQAVIMTLDARIREENARELEARTRPPAPPLIPPRPPAVIRRPSKMRRAGLRWRLARLIERVRAWWRRRRMAA